MTNQERIAALALYYSTLTPERVSELANYYAAEVHFKDPFNEVDGIPAVTRIFSHMFAKVDVPRFVVHTQMAEGDQGFLTWDMHYCFRGDPTPQVIRGASHVRFNAEGLIVLHRDYWDVAEELYEKLPVLGSLMRFLRRRGAA